MKIRVQEARAQDVPLLSKLIKEMSEYERLPLSMTEDMLLRDGFGETPKFRSLLAYADDEAAGYALVHGCYASFEGPGLFLEDLYVREDFRGKSVGKALLSAVARLAIDQDCFALVLNVLQWNSPAFTFFSQAGAAALDDRKTLRIERSRLADL